LGELLGSDSRVALIKVQDPRLNCKEILALKKAILAVLVLTIITAVAWADIPTQLSFQGRLLNGTVPETGTKDLVFTIYTASDVAVTAAGWPQTKSVSLASNGVFNTTLDVSAFPFNVPYRLGVKYNGNDLVPHQFLTAAPYAMTAKNAYGRYGSFTGPVTIGTTESLNNLVRVHAASGVAIDAKALETDAQANALNPDLISVAVYGNGTDIGMQAEGGTIGSSAIGSSVGIYGETNLRLDSIGVQGRGYYGVFSSMEVAIPIGGQYVVGAIGVKGFGNSYGVMGRGSLEGVQGNGGVCAIYGLGSYGVVGYGSLYGVQAYSYSTLPTYQWVYGLALCGKSDGAGYALHTKGKVKFENLGVVNQSPYHVLLDSASRVRLSLFWAQKATYGYSSRRYKEQISDLPIEPEQVLSLRPVSFTWKKSQKPDIGLIAEEVEKKVRPLVTYNAAGSVEGVRYDRLPVYLLGVVRERQKTLAALQKRLAALEAEGR
jgi:hypothetical protein